MSALGTSMSTCPPLQAELNNYFINCDPVLLGFNSPFAEFLMSSFNRRGLQQLLSPGGGRIRKGILRYDQKLAPASEGTFTGDISCTAETKRGDLTQEYEIDTNAIVFKEQVMEVRDWQETCRSNPEIIYRAMAILMQSVREGTYKKLANEFVANTMWGDWGKIVEDDTANFTVNGSNELVVKTKKDSSIDVYPTTAQTISNATMLTNYCEKPFIVGGYTLKAYYELMQSGCCANQGLNLGDLFSRFGQVVAWDKWLQAAFATPNLSVAIQPGALQVVYFNEYDGTPAVDNALSLGAGKNYTQFVITDPVSGFPMNVRVSDNCGVISMFIHTNTKLFGMPRDMFAAGDDLDEVTFVNKIRVTNV